MLWLLNQRQLKLRALYHRFAGSMCLSTSFSSVELCYVVRQSCVVAAQCACSSLMIDLGTACVAPLPMELRERGTVAVVESGGCDWGVKVGISLLNYCHAFTPRCRFVSLSNMERLGPSSFCRTPHSLYSEWEVNHFFLCVCCRQNRRNGYR